NEYVRAVHRTGAARRLVGYVGRHHIALIALFLALGGTSYAATDGFSSSTSPLYACVTKHFGTLNLTSRSASCPRGQEKIWWNRAGRPGRRGPAGPRGTKGATGQAGPRGAKGAPGVK